MKRQKTSLVQKVVNYYAERVAIYDETAGYNDKVAEKLRTPIKERYRKLFAGHEILEIACGSGYWTRVIGEVAKSVLAIDINSSMINLARKRCRRLHNVKFHLSDAFTLQGVPDHFTAAFAIWWWSHMPKSEIRTFLTALHSKLVPGALVLFTDQLPGADFPRRIDADGNNIEYRSLQDGRIFEVVKNHPTATELAEVLGTVADQIKYVEHTHEKSWTVTCRMKQL